MFYPRVRAGEMQPPNTTAVPHDLPDDASEVHADETFINGVTLYCGEACDTDAFLYSDKTVDDLDIVLETEVPE